MRDFTVNVNKKRKILKKHKKARKLNETSYYEITYADGRIFTNIQCTEENLTKIKNIIQK